MIAQSKELLGYMGVQVVEAPSEGEAQAAVMARTGTIWASASQDWDSLLFGSPRLVRNLSVSGKKKVPGKDAYVEVSPELLELKHVLNELGINQEQLIAMGLLVGTDFNPGIKGIGPKTAFKIIKEEKTLDKIIAKAIEKNPWEGPEPGQIMEFFLNPPSKEVKLKSPPIEPGKIVKFLVDEHEFSAERIGKAVERLSKERPGKHSLGSWLK
jgi:flap endonuclease-1